MPLSWNEIKTRASSFVLEWSDRLLSADGLSVKEKAEAQAVLWRRIQSTSLRSRAEGTLAQTYVNEFLEIFRGSCLLREKAREEMNCTFFKNQRYSFRSNNANN